MKTVNTKTVKTAKIVSVAAKKAIIVKSKKTAKGHQMEIFEYIRRHKDGKVIPVGVIYGTVCGKTIKIGWSKCASKMGDKFDSETGLSMAQERAVGSITNIPPTPLCIRKQVRQFSARCVRYFKDAHKLEMPV